MRRHSVRSSSIIIITIIIMIILYCTVVYFANDEVTSLAESCNDNMHCAIVHCFHCAILPCFIAIIQSVHFCRG